MPADLQLLEEIYGFARARQADRIKEAERKGFDAYDRARREFRTMQLFYADAKQHPTNHIIALAIDMCRSWAMKDQDHPDYDPLWTLPKK